MSKITRTLMPMIVALLLSATLTGQTTQNEQRPRRMDVSTFQNQLKSRENPYRDTASTRETLIEEDFSLFTAGSEQSPDGTNLTDPETYMVDPNYTHQPGWNGGHVFQAGGVCYFADWYWAYLNTPEFEMTGTVHFYFRARMDASSGQHETTVGLLYDVENPQIIDMATFYMTPEWTTYEFEFFNPESRDVFIQINAYTEWFLDDVTLERNLNFVPAPTAYDATHYTMEGFDANWGEVNTAGDYLLTVFKRDYYGPEQIYVAPEGFEGINNDGQWIDYDNPNFPEGWTVKLQAGDNRQVTTDAHTGNVALCLDAEGDTIILPSTSGRFLASNFWLRVLYLDPDNVADLEIIGKRNGRWEYTGVFYWASYLYQYHGNDWFDDDLISTWLENKYDEIGVAYVGDGGTVWAIDDWDYTTSQACHIVNVLEDLEIAAPATTYTVTGLDPAVDYYYYLKASNAEYGVSAQSNHISCFGLCPPIVEEASNIGDGTYTANWQTHPKADAYEIHNYAVFTAEANTPGALVLSETFAQVNNGLDPQNYMTDPDPYRHRLDEYTEFKDWYGTGVILADQMVGAANNTYFFGQITTTELTLDHAPTFHVKTTVWGKEGETLEITALTTGEMQQFVFTETGFKTIETDFNAGPESGRERLKFMDANGTPFLINTFQVSQDQEIGDKCYGMLRWDWIDGAADSYTYTGLAGYGWADYAFDLIAIHNAFGTDYQSEVSDKMEVTVTLGLNEFADEVSVYPNPANEKVFLGSEAERVMVYDTKGSLVLSLRHVCEVNTSMLPNGLYLLRVSDQQGQAFAKEIVVKH